jgi:hypothetical protein
MDEGWVDGMSASVFFGVGLVVVCAAVASLALKFTRGRLFFDMTDHIAYRKTPEMRAQHLESLSREHRQSVLQALRRDSPPPQHPDALPDTEKRTITLV